MNDSKLKDLLLNELSGVEADQLKDRLRAGVDPDEVEEWRQLSGLGVALSGLREEEPPRRIAFVSDKVLAPAWWERLFASGPQMALASAALVMVGLLGHGYLSRPVAVGPVPGSAVVNLEAQIQERVQAELARRPVTEPVKVDNRAAGELAILNAKLATMERKLLDRQEQDMVAVGQQIQVLRRDLGMSMRAQNASFSPVDERRVP